MPLLLIAYAIASYWTYGRVNRNKVYIYSDSFYHFGRKLIFSLFLGWILIPIALLMSIFGIRK